MARLFGTEIPNEKRIEASLPYIYGIGRSTSKRILEQAGINPDIRTGQLTDEQLTKIVQVITTDGIFEGDLRGLPVRGQRTRTNARTRKGKKKTVGAQAKKK